MCRRVMRQGRLGWPIQRQRHQSRQSAEVRTSTLNPMESAIITSEATGRKGFIQGVAWAIAVCMRGGLEGAGERLLTESGLRLRDFRNAKVEEYDLSQVRIASKATAP